MAPKRDRDGSTNEVLTTLDALGIGAANSAPLCLSAAIVEPEEEAASWTLLPERLALPAAIPLASKELDLDAFPSGDEPF